MPAPTRSRNADLLAAYGRCRSTANRNAVVHANLPLVWRLAREESLRSGHPFEDLVQVGCLGLIRAVERYEARHGTTLSTAACPWIRGAMRHYLRDRCRPLSGSHHLLELVARGQRLQQQRQHQGLQALAPEALAQALGTTTERWLEGLQLQRGLRLVSLDQPQGSAEGECLVELLPAPPRDGDGDGADGYGAALRWEQRRRLWRGLKGLDRSQRRLVLGRLLLRRSWRELGQPLGLSGKVSQRRCQRALELLRQRLLEGEQVGGDPAGVQTSPSPWASSIASTAASSV
jgi:RNA polymerase sigma factor (sigma-70 family)